MDIIESPCRAARVAVVIVNYRTPDLALRCLETVERERGALPQLRAIIVDGHSDDGSAAEMEAAIHHSRFSPWVTLLALPLNGGFGWANNQAILRLLADPQPPEFIHLLNPDAAVEPSSIEILTRRLIAQPEVAAVGSQLLELDGSKSGSAFAFPTLRGEFARGARTGIVDRLLRVKPIVVSASEPQSVDWVTGASVMLRTAAITQAGLFDDGFFLYHEEMELMWRLRKRGWNIVYEPRSLVLHVGGAATGVHTRPTESRLEARRPAYWYESRSRFFARSKGWWAVPLALVLWTAGHSLFRLRRGLGLAPGTKLVEHERRDQWKFGRPRALDRRGAVVFPGNSPGSAPAWMIARR